MKYIFSICLLLGFVHANLFSQTTFPKDGPYAKKSVYHLFTNAVVHIAPGVVDTASVLIGKGKIIHVGSKEDMELQANTVEHDMKGLHIYPSFIELNSDYGISPLKKRENKPGPEYERMKDLPASWNDAIHPEIMAAERFSPKEEDAKKLRNMGFGVCLVHLQDGIARGSSVLVATGKGNANENVLKSQVGMHYSFSKGSSVQDYPSSLMGSIALLRQTFYDADWYAQAKNEETNISLEAIINNQDLPAFFSTRDKYDLERVNRLGDEFDRDMIVYGVGKSYQIDLEKLERVSAIVAPLNFPKPYDTSDPDLSRYIDQSSLMHWEMAPFNPFLIDQSQLALALSANGIEKTSTFFEALRTSNEMGLDADTAIAGLTTIPARLVGMENELGQIKAEFLSNFFISTGDIFAEEDAEILSHWIGEEEYILKDPDKLELSGVFNLNINDKYYELHIKSQNPYKCELVNETETDTLKTKANLSQQNRQVSLSFLAFDSSGYYRLSATTLNGGRIWDGTGINPAGDKIKWTAIKDRSSDKEAKKDSLAQDSIPQPPAMLYPFKSYGFEELPSAETILFKNATIWTCDSTGVIENGDLLISDGKILAVGSGISANNYLDKKNQDNYTEIDLKGKHISPGIIDEHSHIAISRGVNEGTQTSSAEVRIGDSVNPDDINIFRQLSGGVTSAQLLHGSANPIGGQSAIIKLRWGRGMDEMIFEEAPGFMKFALGENVKQSNWGDNYRIRFPQTRMGVEQVFYDYFYRAREYGDLKRLHEASSQQNKKKPRKKDDTKKEPFRTDIELEALLEVLNSERFITCHSYVQSEINMLMHVADSMGFTLNTFTHVLEGYKVADKLHDHGASASTFSDWWAYKYEVNDAIPHNASILNQMEVNVAINSDDAEMGRRLNQEAAKGIKYGGMSEEDALKMVTLNPAKMLHIDEYVGSISEGKHADIVVWTDNPLSVYAQVEYTFIDGIKYFDKSMLKELEERDAKRRAYISALMQNAKEGGAATIMPSRKMERYYECETMD